MKRTRVRYDRIAALALSAMLLVPVARGMLGTGAAAGERGERYVVETGDTLWEIALETNPDGDPRSTVYAIAQANDLGDGDITAGQVLQLP